MLLTFVHCPRCQVQAVGHETFLGHHPVGLVLVLSKSFVCWCDVRVRVTTARWRKDSLVVVLCTICFPFFRSLNAPGATCQVVCVLLLMVAGVDG